MTTTRYGSQEASASTFSQLVERMRTFESDADGRQFDADENSAVRIVQGPETRVDGQEFIYLGSQVAGRSGTDVCVVQTFAGSVTGGQERSAGELMRSLVDAVCADAAAAASAGAVGREPDEPPPREKTTTLPLTDRVIQGKLGGLAPSAGPTTASNLEAFNRLINRSATSDPSLLVGFVEGVVESFGSPGGEGLSGTSLAVRFDTEDNATRYFETIRDVLLGVYGTDPSAKLIEGVPNSSYALIDGLAAGLNAQVGFGGFVDGTWCYVNIVGGPGALSEAQEVEAATRRHYLRVGGVPPP